MDEKIKLIPQELRNNIFFKRIYRECQNLFIKVDTKVDDNDATRTFEIYEKSDSLDIYGGYESLLSHSQMNIHYDKETEECNINYYTDQNETYNWEFNLNIKFSEDKNFVLIFLEYKDKLRTPEKNIKTLNSIYDKEGRELKREVVKRSLPNKEFIFKEEYTPLEKFNNFYVAKYTSETSKIYGLFYVTNFFADPVYSKSFEHVSHFFTGFDTFSNDTNLQECPFMVEISEEEYERLMNGNTSLEEINDKFNKANKVVRILSII